MSDCKNCTGVSRRQFIGYGSTFLGAVLSSRWAFADPLPPGRARAAILLFLDGGPSQFETFDPKPGRQTGGPTTAIDTGIAGVQIASTLPRIARHLGRLSIIRSMSTHEAEHARAKHLMHTGYSPNPTVAYPSAGSIIGKETDAQAGELPAYVCVGSAPVGEGFLSAELAPFNIRDPMQEVPNLQPPDGVTDDRVQRRREILAALERRFAEGRDPTLAGKRSEMYQSAYRLIDSEHRTAFHLDEEPQDRRESFGMNAFGQGCLMARRLIEAGVKFVEVQLNGWDTHQDNFSRTTELGGQLDQGFGALMDDLTRTGLIDETLVICMGEFGRTPQITGDDGRNHFSRAWSAVVGGGPIAQGVALGRTNDDGTEVAERPVDANELFATIFHAMGVDYTKRYYSPQGRPITLSDAPTHIRELMA